MALLGEPDTDYDLPAATWEDEVRQLYMRHPTMEADELETLLEAALTGERPEHPDLPLFLRLAFVTD